METNRLAWLAGLIDGEGCLYARVCRRPNNPASHGMEVRLEIHTASSRMIDAVAAILIDLGIAHTRTAPKMQPRSTRPATRLRVHKKRALRDLLRAVLPYLVVKHPEAVRVLEYLELTCLSHFCPVTEANALLVSDLKTLKRLA